MPFLVIIGVLMIRGRALPLRSEAAERPSEIGSGRVRAAFAIPAIAIGFAVIAFGLPTNGIEAATTTATTAIIVLSLVVVTGYTGQLSLAQFALAGAGAWIAARLVVNYDFPFELAALIGVLGTIPVGLVVALPALRTRGVNLAVATLGLSLVLESLGALPACGGRSHANGLTSLKKVLQRTATHLGDLRRWKDPLDGVLPQLATGCDDEKIFMPRF